MEGARDAGNALWFLGVYTPYMGQKQVNNKIKNEKKFRIFFE